MPKRPTSAHDGLVSYRLLSCEKPSPKEKCKTHPQALLLTGPEKMLCPVDDGQKDSFNGGGHFLCSEHNCLTNGMYLLTVLKPEMEDKVTKPPLKSPSKKSACAPNTGVSKPAFIKPHLPIEYLLSYPIRL